MQTRRANRYPSFYWQALLIVLPALLLAGIGLLFLRQDRLLAQLDATEQAAKTARRLADFELPAAFRLDPGDLSLWRVPSKSRFQAKEDPLLRLTAQAIPLVACLVDRDGKLVYPPPFTAFPEPALLPIEQLDDPHREAWVASQNTVHSGTDPATAIEQLQALASVNLPEPLLALAQYELGVLWQDAGNEANAVPYFERILTHHAQARAESGVLLAIFAAQRLMQMPAAAPPGSSRAGELTAFIAWQAVFKPDALSRSRLEPLPDNKSWLDLWRVHEVARDFHRQVLNLDIAARLAEAASPAWVWIHWRQDQRWLVTALPASGNRLWLAIPEGSVRRLINQAIAAADPPPYFGVQVSVSGHDLTPPAKAVEILADVSQSVPEASGRESLFRVRVRLANPGALYARQRQRTRWLAALIGLSVSAVFAGLAAAWRAFHHQRELNEMKTNFVSSVSHELRAPIASVRLMAEELEDLGPGNPQKNREYQRFIIQECRRLSGLVENVLDFSRHEQGRKQYEFEPVDLVALAQETTRLMRTYAAERALQITTITEGEPEPVEADAQSLQQVLVNLVDNAIKHSPPRSPIEVGLRFAKDQVQLWVQDHGEGIPAADHQKIFERFYRCGTEMRRKTQGVGLGLAIVKYVTEAHRGTVAVASVLGQGSRFTVTLPLKHPE
jgi:signal transduction histidine kinase